MAYVSAMGEVDNAFARLIRSARKRRGWSQDYLADESDIGRRTLSRWENGDVSAPDAEQVIAVADALGIPREAAFHALGWLSRESEPQPDPVTEELLVLRGAVVSILERLDAALERQEHGSNESVTER